MKPRILILHTGGTIGMEATSDGLRPIKQFDTLLQQGLEKIASLSSRIDFDIIAFDQPMDSADLTPAHWPLIAGELVSRWDSYDGFVVLHGSDTMAWTASALSFMLAGTDKPVILTGSQIPLIAAGSDAPKNLCMALELATDPRICEVGICFGGRLLRGNRAGKIATTHYDAFISPNYLPLAETGTEIVVHQERLLQPRKKDFFIPGHLGVEAVAVLTVYPGISSHMVESVLSMPDVHGLVLRSYGVGNMPHADKHFTTVIGDAIARGVTVLNTTQCLIGAVAQGIYASGAAFAGLGVVSAGDMTLEAACTKLHILIAQGLGPDDIRRQIVRPYQGELTPASSHRPQSTA